MLSSILGGAQTESALAQSSISLSQFVICMTVSLLIGLLIALSYKFNTRYSKSFLVTLATLPAVVSMVIMMVNGSIGAGIAVAGTFSLVRFRSQPGTAKEIGAIFLAMSTGLACGMMYYSYAILFTIILCAIMLIYSATNFGEAKSTDRVVNISIPESLDYDGIFDDIFEKYTKKHELIGVKTTNMGSLFRLTYFIKLKNRKDEKNFIDDLRCRNGNLEISSGRSIGEFNEL